MANTKFSTSSVTQGLVKSKSMLVGNDGDISDFESIATTTVGSGGSATVTFSSIPATYTHLQIRGFARTGAETQLDTSFNSTGGTDFSWHTLIGYGSGTESAGAANQSKIVMEAMTNAASVFTAYIIDILDYANTNKFKTTRNLAGYDNNSAGRVSINSGLWRFTNAITSITLTARDTTFQQYSHFALYGIRTA